MSFFLFIFRPSEWLFFYTHIQIFVKKCCSEISIYKIVIIYNIPSPSSTLSEKCRITIFVRLALLKQKFYFCFETFPFKKYERWRTLLICCLICFDLITQRRSVLALRWRRWKGSKLCEVRVLRVVLSIRPLCIKKGGSLP